VQARDLAILAASVRRRELEEDAAASADNNNNESKHPRPQKLRVLDVMCGSGGRGARYLAQAGAAEVWSNDFNPQNLPTIAFNLAAGAGLAKDEDGDANNHLPSSAAEVEAAGRARLAEAATWRVPGLLAPVHEWRSNGDDSGVVARATCADAGRLLAALGLRAGAASADDDDDQDATLFQLVDLDSFGSADTNLVSLALGCAAYGGMLFLTSTDGFVSSGKRPERALAAYGAWTRSFPTGSPEQGMRALIGHAAREAAAQGLAVEPLFSYYSFHGPVFRVMLRVTRGGNGRRPRRIKSGDDKDDERRKRTHAQRGFDSSMYGFIGHCRAHGETGKVGWEDLGRGSAAFCPACRQGGGGGGNDSHNNAELAGPMWLGPLHDGAFVDAMVAEAERRGWLSRDGGGRPKAGEADGPTTSARLRAAERDAKTFYTGRVSRTNPQLPLAELLAVMREEADERLPPLYLTSEFLGRRLARCPPRDGLIAALRERGWVAARCQLERRALRTDAPLAEVMRVAGEAFEGCGVR
jgi:tRNA (guanine26-N2/guanine27-N2)-dimethyltransferase